MEGGEFFVLRRAVPITRSHLMAKINLLCPPATQGGLSLDVAALITWEAKGSCMFSLDIRPLGALA